MGNIGSVIWGFIWNTEDAIRDTEQSIIDGDDNLKWAQDELRTPWNRAKNLKNEWKEIETDQKAADIRDRHNQGPTDWNHLNDRILDLGEDFLIEEVNELGVIDIITEG
jgi:hypothetical protein